MAEDPVAQLSGGFLYCRVFGFFQILGQLPNVGRAIQPAYQIHLIGNKPFSGFVNSPTPSAEVGFAAVHQDKAKRQTKVHADDLQDELNLLKVFRVWNVRTESLQFFTRLANDFHAGRDAFELSRSGLSRFCGRVSIGTVGRRQAISASRHLAEHRKAAHDLLLNELREVDIFEHPGD